MTKYRIFAITAWMLLLCNSTMFGQATATISGAVKDSAGAAVPNAKMVLLNQETGISRSVETDGEGHYSALSLSLGNYRVTGTAQGFQTEVRTGIVLTVGAEAIVDLVLTVGAVSQTLEVAASNPLVESTSASLGSLVDGRTIRSLPLNGRSYDQLALLQPGVIPTSPGPPTGTSQFSFGSGKRFSVGGQRPNSNSFLLDGTNINDQANGTPGGAAGTNLGVDTILEFRIFTDAYKAEYGHSAGSVITAVTRSGTNTVHGTAFEYIRNSALDARNFFDVTQSPPAFKRNQFGGVLGGPIKRDKTFFFVGYEGLRQGLGTTQIATVPTAQTRQGILPTGTVTVNSNIVPYLNLYPLPNGAAYGDGTAQFISAPQIVTNEDNFMVRVDHQVSAKLNIFGRYTFDRDNLRAPLSLPIQVQVVSSKRQYSTLQMNNILGPKALNNARFAFNRTPNYFASVTTPDPGPQLSIVPGQPLGAIQIGGLNTAGSRALTPLGSSNGNGANLWAFNIFEWGDDFSYIAGKHTLKFGADVQRMQANYTNPSFLYGIYNFSTLNNFLAGIPSNLQAGSPLGITPNWGLRQTVIGVYAQDDYRVSSRITLNLGLRWETSTDPVDVGKKMAILPSPSATATVPSDSFFSIGKKNFGPRFGIAWKLNASGKTVIRAGGGIFYNQILPWAYFTATRIAPFFGTFSLANPPFPNGAQALKGGGLTALLVQAPINKTPVNDQYNFSIQQEIFSHTVFQAAYAGNKSNHLLTLREVDTATPTFQANGQPFYPAGSPRVNPAWAGIRLESTDGNSNYNAVSLSLRREFSSGFQGQIFYTLSKAIDENSNTSTGESARSPATVMNPYSRRQDRGLAEFDVRNAVGFNFSYPLPFRANSKFLGNILNAWTLDALGTFASGEPFSARLAASVSRDLASALAERPNLNPGANQNPTQGTTGAGCAGIAADQPLGTPIRYYNPCGFSLPLAGTYGNLGRDTLIGPGLANIDLALEKTFKVRENIGVSFKAEMFNLMNHANFGLPNTTALTAAGAANASAGVITYTTTSARQLQFALRINF